MRLAWRCVGVCLVFGAMRALAATGGAQPKIQADKPVYEFGKIWNDKTIEHEFEVKNVGDAPLKIKRVRSTCGCTPVKAKPQTLAPGSSTKIKVRLIARNLKGKIKKTVYVESDDPARPRLGLSFAGEVRQPITMAPAMAKFARLDRKQPSTVEVILTNHLPEPMAPSEPTSSLPNVSGKITEIEKGRKYKVTLTARPPYTRSTLHGKLTLKTGWPKRPTYAINFFGKAPPAVEVRPSSVINLGTLDNSKEYTRTVRIISTDGKPFEVTEVSSTNWRIMPVVREVTEKQEYEVTITARPPYAWGVNRGVLTFRTRSSSSPRLTVQVYGDRPQPIKVSPASLLFRSLSVDKGGQASVTIQVVDSAPVEFPSIRSTLANVKATLEPLADGKGHKLTATATPPLPPGRLQGEIVLTTTHPKMKTLKVPVQSFPIRRPLPAVSVIPDPVLIIPGAGVTTAPTVSRFIVRANRTEKVHVTKVEVTHDEIITSIEPYEGAKDKMTFVRITVPATVKLKPEGEVLTIHTDHKGVPKITRRIARAGTPGARVQRRAAHGGLGARLPVPPPGRAKP